MPNFQEKGIYSGGLVTLGTSPDNNLYISPYLLNLVGGGVTGSGPASVGVSKVIKINFGGQTGGASFRESVHAPAYNIYTGPGSGAVWVYYDESSRDLAFSVIAPVNKITFAKVFWSTTAISILDIQIDTSFVSTGAPNRTEAYVADSSHPESADNFYYDGQKFIGGNLNKPLANFAIMSEVLQGNSLSTFGSTYFVTQTQDNDVYGSGTQIKLKEVFHVERKLDKSYRTYHTKEDPAYGVGSHIAFAKTFALSDVNGDNLYIVINKVTGAPDIVRVSDLGVNGIVIGTTHYLISQSSGPHDNSGNLYGLTALSDILFTAVSTKAGPNNILKTQAVLIRNLHPSGFFKSFEVVASGSANSVYVPATTGNINGYVFELPATTINLGDAPSLGNQQDFIYLQITKKENPDIQLTLNVLSTADIDYANNPDPFTSPNVKSYLETDISIPGRTGSNFTYNPNGGYYEAPNPAPGSNSYYYAIPLAVISRFNQGGSNSGNPNGGLSRIDGKTFNFLNNDEILTSAPIVAKNKSARALLHESLKLALSGTLNNRLEQSNYAPGVWSKKPFQVDYLDSYSEGTRIGATDGGRRYWGGNVDTIEVVSFTFKHNQAFSYPYGNFTFILGTSQSLLQLRVPTSVEGDSYILTDSEAQPLDVSIVWASDGAPVALLGSVWTTSLSNSKPVLQTIEIDPYEAGYLSHTSAGSANICVTFKILHAKTSGLTKVPLSFFKVARGGQDGKQDNFAITPDSATNPKLLELLNQPGVRNSVVNGTTYYDALYVSSYGPVTKGYAMQLRYTTAGSGLGLTPYSIPDTYTIAAGSYSKYAGVYRLLSLLDVQDNQGRSIKAHIVEWLPSGSFKITLSTPVPVTVPLTFIFGLDGQQVDYSNGSLAITNLSQATVDSYNTVSNSTGLVYYYYNSGIHPDQNGATVFGFTSSYNKLCVYAESAVTSSYVQVPVNVEGFNTGLIKIITLIKAADYALLSTTQQSVYELHTTGVYRIKSGTPLMFSTLRALNESGSMVFMYQYGASSFFPFDKSKTYEILDDGFLIATNDGTANDSGGLYSPISERFPIVQDVPVVGFGVSANPLGLNPVLSYNQDGELITPGSGLVIDGRFSLGVFVVNGAGLAVWVALVRQGVKWLMFIYEVRDGQFIVSNPEQAFLSELRYNIRGLQ